MLSQQGALAQVKDVLWPALKAERERVAQIDKWYRWDHDSPHMPQGATREYKQLAENAQAPWGRRVVTAVTDQLYVEGYRGNGNGDNSAPWGFWQANGLDARQIPVHDAAIAYGLAYVTVLPGQNHAGARMPVIRGLDPSEMITVYADPAWDDWPALALRARPAKVAGKPGYTLDLYDDEVIHRLLCDANGEDLEWVTYDEHNAGVCPVVRFANNLDLRGRADGEVEPFIPLLGRIDQTTFDRLVVQRFGAWVVRFITGMTPPDGLPDEEHEEWRRRIAMTLKVSDILMTEDSDAKVGSLPATALDGFISAHDADVRALAAVSQTPVHELIGQMANLSADALASAEASLTRKIERRKHSLGEAWEQTLRLGALVMGDLAAADDTGSQVTWKDMESRSLAQAADALGKIAQMLQVPVELLWEKIPGWTQQDVERAKTLAEQGGGLEALMRELASGQTPPAPDPTA